MSAALQLVEPDTTELQAESSALIHEAQSLAIVDDATFSAAAEFMNGCAALRKKIVSAFADPKKKADEAHKSICALERTQLEPVAVAEAIAKKRISEYRAAQEQRAAEERRRLEAIAKKQEEDRRLQEALDAEADGDSAAAEEIIAAPIVTPPVRVAPPTPKAAVSFREVWKWDLEGFHDLVKHCAAHPEDLCYLSINTVNVNRDVTTRKSAFNKPGIRVYSEKVVAAGGSRR
jgi:hypothetical protein